MLIQWQKGSSNIPNADNETYDPLDSDIGAYLRATVTYKDPESGQTTKMANVQSGYVVLRLASNNNSPEFQDPDTDVDQSDTATREVAENTEAGENIGAPVRATDADSGQKLTYTLGGDSADVFDIDWATGQLKTKAALDEETGPSYTVTVRATDPAGIPQADPAVPDNSDEITVTITVTDVNEPPAIAGDAGDAAVTFDEETGVIATPLDTYMATDPEGVDVASTAWSTAGADGSKFEIDDGALTFKAKPDFEAPTDANKDNVYEVTVRAADADGYIGTMAVKVTFTNEDENGRVMLSKTRPRVGIAVKASVTDPDGSISGLTWQWFRSISAVGDFTAIKDAKSDTYTPVADDVPTPDAMFLRATASYTDGHGGDKSATGAARIRVAVDTRNRAPMFEDQDTETDGVQNTETTRKVEENIKADATDDTPPDVQDVATDNVGRPVMATDPDPNVDALTYTLGGPDAAKFRVRDNGQIEVGAGTMLDYETKTSYMVTVMAEDSFGDSASIMVTIMVTPVDEPPEIMRAPDANVAPEFASATTSRTVAENMVAGEDIGNPVAANDANGDALTYALSGTDAASFDIDPDTGQLMTKAALDFERKSSYSVTVAASDPEGASDMITVTVTVTNEEEMGEVTLSAMQPVVGTEITATLTDPDDSITGTTWQWAKASSRNGSYSNIEDATSMSYTPVDGDIGSYLRATAMYTDGEGSDKSAAKVSDGLVTSNPMFPSETATRSVMENTDAGMNIGEPVTATDADMDIPTYTLGGEDAASFDIDPMTGQLMTKAALDFETKSEYILLTVTATDQSGASVMISVTIMVTDMDEAGTVTLDSERPVVGEMITANLDDPDAGVTGEVWRWARSMDMAAGWTDIDGATDASYTPVDGDIGCYLRATAMYTDGEGSDKSAMGDSDNTVTALAISGMSSGEYAENGTMPVATYMAAGPKAEMASWTLEGDEAGLFHILGGVLSFNSPPDYENPADMDTDNTYTVTVKADDGTYMDTHEVMVMVTNVEEPGMVTLWAGTDALTMAPQVGDDLTATLTATSPT